MRRGLIITAVAALCTTTALAQTQPDPKLEIVETTIEDLGPAVKPTQIPAPPNPGGGGELDLDTIINIGTKIWAIIEKNKPVVNIKNQYATALPDGTRTWSQLEQWGMPRGRIYRLLAKNGYGMQTVKIDYMVMCTSGGRYKGKGRYLTACTIEPLEVTALWGYNVDVTAEVPDSSIVNVGTSEDPVAAMLITVKWKIATTIKEHNGKAVYYARGDKDKAPEEFAMPRLTEAAKRVDGVLEGRF